MKIMKRCLQIALFLLLCVGVSNVTEAKSKEELSKEITKLDEYIKYWDSEVQRIEKKQKILIPAPSDHWRNKSQDKVKAYRDKEWPKVTLVSGVPFRSVDRANYLEAYKRRFGKGEEARRAWKRRSDKSVKVASEIITPRLSIARTKRAECKRELAALAISKAAPAGKMVDKKPTKFIPHLDRFVVTKWKGSDVRYEMVHLVDGEDPGWVRSSQDASGLDNMIRLRSYHPEYTILVKVKGTGQVVAEYRTIFGKGRDRLRVDFISDKVKLKQWNE